ncbi:PAAR domain-containing protein [Actinacidiphila acididurans]|uniref:PAAR domain-containing protein n=1 Tax=Actinacidiphila acididurans TaxID=2784346 RepID=A0ABS2TTN1_9ACTN|nr:PAAR domain-containing protein [Actinacidiphila acididurans]MBM9506694.1 PAAR domain-containing protein [Actinacidiphila acididurans]
MAAAAARTGDPTGHGGVIAGPGVSSVLIGGAFAATVGTPHACPVPPHGTSAIAGPGSATVLIGGRRAARVGDTAACGAPVTAGCPTVLIGG